MAVYLDTETTGLSPARGDAIVEIAIADSAGRTLIDTLVDPRRSIPWYATNVHGITDDMVRGKPTLKQILPRVLDIIASEEVVIYNANFDAPFFSGHLERSLGIRCAMMRFADAMGSRKQKLDAAAKHVGHRWTGNAHRALADALACRSVWLWIERQGRSARGSERRM